ncbi:MULTISPECIES: polysaccharide deacetylase [unclassified Paenibacillus]|uniref:polysaccharide deacetylase n=1 Tax=unclassified Paenibacillus TaxID=185978 RepID=UPI0030F64462
MKDSKSTQIRRILIRGLLAMAIILLVKPDWETGQSSASSKMYPLQAGIIDPVLSKNNLPAAQTQDLPAPPVNSGGSASPAPVVSTAITSTQNLQNPEDSAAISALVKSKDAPAAAVVAAAPKKTQKTVYLTFDDGPSKVTAKVLEILRQQEVKATFFVLGEQARSRPELINAIWEQGHVIGNHTYNHNYHDLYSGFTEFWTQIKQTEEIVREITGVRPQLVRAPGGTFGHFDATYFDLLKQAGYSVMDWTVDSGDSRRRGVPASEILQGSVADMSSSQVILLLHDGAGHEESAKALPKIIERYKAAGYNFGQLDASQQPVHFRVSATMAGANRSKPPQDWIHSNIVPNAGLFASGKPLVLEVGRLETKLDPGEYRISQGQYMVPLRAVIERLGGRVSWDSASRSGLIAWNGRNLTVDALQKQLKLALPDGSLETRGAEVQMIGSSLWISLRELLTTAGHLPQEARATAEERRVRTT